MSDDLRNVITKTIRETAKIKVTDAWEGAYTSLNEKQIVEAILAALAALPMHCDCTKDFKDWTLSDQLIAKAREAEQKDTADACLRASQEGHSR